MTDAPLELQLSVPDDGDVDEFCGQAFSLVLVCAQGFLLVLVSYRRYCGIGELAILPRPERAEKAVAEPAELCGRRGVPAGELPDELMVVGDLLGQVVVPALLCPWP